jgi:hypothetical protein
VTLPEEAADEPDDVGPGLDAVGAAVATVVVVGGEDEADVTVVPCRAR